MTGGERLRAAANLAREIGGAATPGPWRFTDSETVVDVWEAGMVVVSADADPIANCQDDWYENDPGEPAPINDARHIAAHDPQHAALVADLLEAVWDEIPVGPTYRAALALADHYLGSGR